MVAIVGAGPAGIVAARVATTYGLKPTVFTKHPSLGGAWNPKSGLMWDRMATNISTQHSQFSGFPWQGSRCDFPNKEEVAHYLTAYAARFHLEPHFQYNTEITRIQHQNDQWKVESMSGGKKQVQDFRFVLICSGMYSQPYIPPFLGKEQFRGMILHSKDYKSAAAFQGKKVAVIGNSFSGCEISADLGRTAASVTHIFRRARWIIPRFHPSATGQLMPWDALSQSRAGKETNPQKHARLHALSRQEEISPLLAIETPPSDPPFVAISDTYLNEVQAGRIALKKGEVQGLDSEGVVFQDGTKESVDAVLACTGYRADFPFLTQELLSTLEFQPESSLPILLHKTVFHPALPNGGCVGLYRGPYFSVMERQAEWACRVFSGQLEPPSQEEMQRGITEARNLRNKLPSPQYPYNHTALYNDISFDFL